VLHLAPRKTQIYVAYSWVQWIWLIYRNTKCITRSLGKVEICRKFRKVMLEKDKEFRLLPRSRRDLRYSVKLRSVYLPTFRENYRYHL